MQLSREELYNEIWAKPISHLAEAWEVKSWDIKRWCRERDIPMPEQGHWARLKHGKPVEQPPLPPVEKSGESIVDQTSRQVFEPLPVFAGESELSFKVPDWLRNPDPLITAAEKGLAKERWDQMRRSDDDQFPVRVMAANVGRALRIVDTLIKCWRRRGYRVEIRDRFAFVYLREIRQRVHLYEICKTLPKANENEVRQLKPTGRLAFRMDWWGGREWKDSKRPLEEQILDILNHMELSARQLERERDKPPREEKVLISKGAKEEPLLLSDDFGEVLADAQRWKQLKVLDEYLAALFAASEHTPDFLEWFAHIQKARRQAEPFKRS